MTQILLEQHYYASAPIGLSIGRGFKSVAKSPGIGPPEPVEDHCSYYRPAGKKDQRPVNWGWTRLPDGRTCVHRVGFSGNDDQNRPLNFLAANFVAPAGALDAIDHDIPALMRWIAERNPDRYTLPNGKESGFAFRHDQLYEKQGWDPKALMNVPVPERAKLGQLKPVAAPIAELMRYSEAADKSLPQMWEKLKPMRGVVKSLFQALLCKASERRTVVVVSAGEGENESEMERLIAEFLFAVLPYHLRKAITYSTYLGQDAGGSALPDRRLLFTTKFNTEIALPSEADGTSGWLVSGAGAPPLIPRTLTTTAKFYQEFCEAGRWDEIIRVRNRAASFDYPEDADWLPDVRQMLRWATASTLAQEDYESLFRASSGVRPSAVPLLEDAHRFASSAQPGVVLPTSPANMVRAYCSIASRIYPALPPAERERQGERIVQHLAGLFDWNFYQLSDKANRESENEAFESFGVLLGQILKEPTLEPLRPAILQACLARLEARLESPKSQDDFHRCRKLWLKVREGGLPKGFVERIAVPVAGLIYRFAESVGSKLSTYMKDFVIPVLAWLESSSANDLHERLVFISDIILEDEAPLVQLLVEARRNGKLTDAMLHEIANRDASYLLYWYGPWHGLVEQAPTAAAILQVKLESPALLASWWEKAPTSADSPLTKSALALFEAYLTAEDPAGRQMVAKSFPSDTKVIVEALRQTEEDYPPLLSIRFASAHFTLIRLLLRAGSEPGVDAQVVKQKAVVHLGTVFGWLASRRFPEDQLVGRDALRPFVRTFVKQYGDPESRTRFAEYAGTRALEFGAGNLQHEEPLLTEWRREMTEADQSRDWPPLTAAEAEWLSHVCCLATAGAGGETRPRAAAAVAIHRPSLVLEKPRDPFAEFFRKTLTELPGVWEAVARQFVKAALSTLGDGSFEAWAAHWLAPGSPYTPIVDVLRKRNLLGQIGRTLAEKAESKSGAAGLRQLSRVPNCPEISEPAKQHFFAVIGEMLPRKAERIRASLAAGTPMAIDEVTREFDSVADCARQVKPAEAALDYWAAVAEWFATLNREMMATLPAASLLRLGACLPRTSHQNAESEPFHLFFEPLSKAKAQVIATPDPAPGEVLPLDAGPADDVPLDLDADSAPRPFEPVKVADAFVILAESLFRPLTDGRHITRDPGASGLPLFEAYETLLKDPRQPDLYNAVWSIVSTLPQSNWMTQNRGGNIQAYTLIVARARLVNALYSNSPANIAGVFGTWGRGGTPGGPPPQYFFTSFALLGFLTADGTDPAKVKAQWKIVLSRDFSPLVKSSPEWWKNVVNVMSQYLPWAIPDGEEGEYLRTQLAGQLR